MGLLDEAIREHLELKRRHGADPGEVARLEHEALGPVRRAEPAAAADEDEPAETVATASEPADDHDAPPGAERDEGPTPDPQVEQPTQHFDVHDAESPAEDRPLRREEPREQAIPADDPDAEEIVAADEEPEPDDVLEETPEFLQETPEHERLWFEQKPPRDFDF